jgi:RNA polymerase sigma-70 factor (ECF subfamily)
MATSTSWRLTEKQAEEERALIRRIQQGKEVEAYAMIYRQYVNRIYPLALRMSADPARAEELTQDIFVRAWEKIGLFRGESSFYTWLYRLAVNFILQSERSRKRRSRREMSCADPGAAAAAAPAGNPAGSLDSRLDLERAIARLPAGARAVLLLHDLEGLTHREIARLTGTSVGGSKAQLHRARRLMRKVLEQ